MALLLLCGQPCSGKSTIARLIADALASFSSNVIIIDETSLSADSKLCYEDMAREKNLRGVLRSAVDRAVSKEHIVIVDSLNNIKGYRYELWCLARAAGTLYSLVHCNVSAETARAWNADRLERGETAYPPPIMEDLLRRFETPKKHNRWDSPLFEMYTGRDTQERVSEVVADIVTFVTSAKEGGARGGPRNLQPTMATQNAKVSDTNRLYEMDKATQEVINVLMEVQTASGGSPAGDVQFGSGLPSMYLNRSVGLPELRRLRRTFLKLTSHSSIMGPPPSYDMISSKRMFLDYLTREIAAGT